MKTDVDQGVTPIDLEQRAQQFGSNKKEATKITPFYKLFLGALEDFMERLLLVCAAISVTIQLIFSDDTQRRTGTKLNY